MGEERLYKLIIGAVLICIAGLIYLISGGNKRERKETPVGMYLLSNPPFLRYFMYAMGILMFGFVVFISVLAILDGAFQNAGVLIIVIDIMGALCLASFFLAGRVMYARHIFFNGEKIIIGHFLSEPDILEWREITGAKIKKTTVKLYRAGGQKCVDVYASMIGFAEFRAIAEQKCAHLL